MTTKSQVSRRAWTPVTSKSRVSAGVPGYSVNLLLFTYWYFSSGHLRFSGHWCPNLNLAKISLSLSRLKSTHVQTRGNNIKFILPHCSKDVFKHSFLPAALRGWNALPQSAVEATSLELFKASLPGVTY